jgi:putative transposase
LDLISSAASEYGLQLLGWCLMPNHVHWIAIPRRSESLAQTFRRTHSQYAMHVNRRHQRASGHLWQNRYYSCLLGENHIWRALRYVEMNPVRASLVSRAEEFEWSSAACHTGSRQPPSWMEAALWASRFSSEQ